MRKNRLIIPALLAFLSLQGYAQELNDSITSGKPAKYSDEVVEIGYHKAQRLEESTSSISTVYNEDFNKRSAKNIANSLFGYGTKWCEVVDEILFGGSQCLGLGQCLPCGMVSGWQADGGYGTVCRFG